MESNIITLPEEAIKQMKEKDRVKRFLQRIFSEGRIVGAVTPYEPTLEAAQKIGEAGGSILSRGDGHATGVVLPKIDSNK